MTYDTLALPDVPRTYPHAAYEHWTDEDWRRMPLVAVPTRELIPTQSDVSVNHVVRYLNGDTAHEYPRVVSWQGRYYLHDGHHRWVIALIRGKPYMVVRLVEA